MSAVNLTIQALLKQTGVTTTASTRIYPLPLKQGTKLPAIAVELTAESEEMLLQGASQYPVASVRVHCIAETATDASALGEKVKAALRDHLYTDGNSPPLYRASFQKEALDFTDYADNLTTHRRVMSFSVRWR